MEETYQGLDEGAGSPSSAATIDIASNDFGNRQYDGPQPPRGHGTHHYHFMLSALDVGSLGLKQGATKGDVEKAMQGHVLGTAELVGLYARRGK